MITRFDHLVIAVPDLEAALTDCAAAGFDVAAGGRHPALGTHNAIIRFGLDYIELLAVEDPAKARAAGPFGAEFLSALEQGAGAVGFVLASARLEDEAAGLDGIGLAHRGPFAMQRQRPDGHVLAWRLVIPGGSPWRKPWPFLIEWTTSDDDRLRWDPPGNHANGACSVSGLELVVADLDAARRLYEEGLGLAPVECSTAAYTLGAFTLRVREPGNEHERDGLARHGPGPAALHLARRSSRSAGEADAFTLLGTRFRFD